MNTNTELDTNKVVEDEEIISDEEQIAGNVFYEIGEKFKNGRSFSMRNSIESRISRSIP